MSMTWCTGCGRWRMRKRSSVSATRWQKKLVIADGHHRYETALAYRNECRAALGATDPNAPHEKVMMTFINMQAEGLTILPTHRVVSNLAGFSWNGFRQQLDRKSVV